MQKELKFSGIVCRTCQVSAAFRCVSGRGSCCTCLCFQGEEGRDGTGSPGSPGRKVTSSSEVILRFSTTADFTFYNPQGPDGFPGYPGPLVSLVPARRAVQEARRVTVFCVFRVRRERKEPKDFLVGEGAEVERSVSSPPFSEET